MYYYLNKMSQSSVTYALYTYNNIKCRRLSVSTLALGELMGSRHKYGDSGLPFVEIESCTASKQEHIVSVNLREISLHLLKYGTQKKSGCSPLQVHAMSTRYVAAQLESTRLLCQILCRAANVDPRLEQERGFCLV